MTAAMQRIESRKTTLTGLLVALLLFGLTIQAGLSIRRMSPTIDEFGHLPLGYSFLVERNFMQDVIHPPLMRMWCAFPLLFQEVRWPSTGAAETMDPNLRCYLFMHQNRGRYQELFSYSRWMVVGLALLLGFYVFQWASRLYGRRAGILALTLYAFCPNILAHSSLVTTDLGVTAFVFFSSFHWWAYCRGSPRGHLLFAGLFLGFALLSKSTALFLIPIHAALLLVERWKSGRLRERSEVRRLAGQLGLLVFLGLAVVCLGYGFCGLFRPLRSFSFDGHLFRSLQGLLPGFLPVPLPEPYVLGIDYALVHGKNLPEGAFYLMGEFSRTGWWYYFMLAWLVKVPIPTQVGMLAAVLLKWKARKGSALRDELFLLVPPILFFTVISLLASLNIGFRYVLVALPFLFVWMSELAANTLPWKKWRGAGMAAGGIWYICSAAQMCPNYLAYFNELVDGPEGGARYLIDSNLDWGQSLLELQQYLAERNNPEIKLAYFGRVDPSIYGIRYQPLEDTPTSGLIVISTSFLHGAAFVYPIPGEVKVHETRRWIELYRFARVNQFAWLRQYKPVAILAHTLYVYEISEASLRRKSGVP